MAAKQDKTPPSTSSLHREIERLRIGRPHKRDRCTPLGDYLPQQFKRECEKPYKKLGKMVDVWESQIPTYLFKKTALVSLRRGILTVSVPDSAVAFDLQRTLAEGTEALIRQSYRGGTLTRIRITVDAQFKQIPDSP